MDYGRDLEMSNAMFYFQAAWTTLKNGNFIITGGSYYCDSKHSNRVLEIDLNKWTVDQLVDMITGRKRHAICNFKNVIYVFAGDAQKGGPAPSEKFEFGPVWEEIAPPTAQWGVSCITYKDHIYISGWPSANIDIYDPVTNSYEVWSEVVAPMS